MNSGENHRDYGNHLSPETCRKISIANKGRKHTLESRRKMSESLRGRSSWNKGISPSDETRRKISESLKGENHLLYGKKLTKEEVEKRVYPRRKEQRETYQLYLSLPPALNVKESAQNFVN